jgi:hypothetical protein
MNPASPLGKKRDRDYPAYTHVCGPSRNRCAGLRWGGVGVLQRLGETLVGSAREAAGAMGYLLLRSLGRPGCCGHVFRGAASGSSGLLVARPVPCPPWSVSDIPRFWTPSKSPIERAASLATTSVPFVGLRRAVTHSDRAIFESGALFSTSKPVHDGGHALPAGLTRAGEGIPPGVVGAEHTRRSAHTRQPSAQLLAGSLPHRQDPCPAHPTCHH